MKLTPQMEQIQARMQPGILSLQGFLGSDTRNVMEIMEDDDDTVMEMGLDHRDIAKKMILLRNSGMEGLGEPIAVPPHFEVTADSARGNLPCPYGDPGIFPKTTITVHNLHLNREIMFTDLCIHLIYAHGFYQGKGSTYRLEPGDLVEILEVVKS